MFLGLYSLLGITSLMVSVRFVSFGTAYRGFRLLAFLAVLWLLTPWWDRRDHGTCAGAGISGLHFHDLRGSGATWAAAAGATVREVMARLGHTTATVALRYQHATKKRDRAIADRLGALMKAATAEPVEPGGTVLPIGS